jgi:phosphoribosyl-AMP cyclohydrolase
LNSWGGFGFFIPKSLPAAGRRIPNFAKNRGGNVTEIDFKKGDGLIPAVIQDAATNEVLMVGYMNRESWEKTLETKRATFWSRSRQKLWIKGETSGNVQEVKEIYLDCDGDTLLLKVNQIGGAACHTGFRSCFHLRRENEGWQLVGERIFDPKNVYEKQR